MASAQLMWKCPCGYAHPVSTFSTYKVGDLLRMHCRKCRRTEQHRACYTLPVNGHALAL